MIMDRIETERLLLRPLRDADAPRLVKLANHPRIAHMLIKAKESGDLALATDIAPLLEERDPLGPEMGININFRI